MSKVNSSNCEIILQFNKTLYDIGRERATDSNDTRENKEVLTSLQRMAETMAKEQTSWLFDPNESVADRIVNLKLEDALQKITVIEDEIRSTETERRMRRDSMCSLGKAPEKPEVPMVILIISAVVIGISLTPTFNDLFFINLDNPTQSWFLSLLSGGSIGSLISYGLLATFGSTYYAVSSKMGLVAGIIFGLSMLLMRLVSVESETSFFFALALALLELTAVFIGDWIGKGLRKKMDSFSAFKIEKGKKEEMLSAIEVELNYQKHELSIHKDTVEQIHTVLHEREFRTKQLQNIINAAIEAITAGYRDGINFNCGKLNGCSK